MSSTTSLPERRLRLHSGRRVAKGRIASIDVSRAKAAPGVLAIVTADNAGKLDQEPGLQCRQAPGRPRVEHYHQAVALVVAETFEQARAAAN
jgi:xanthine dehydrogenase YagR molybdenum-binding subunit